ncbi:uncharacterized protein LOC121243373 [Juglans microcarpa x Juglans regia]|uniref:uncharacterized protein LOC121243373 n=1 Tax=Juglans microcarpa x Juglans regia TaxID=2249226 RepID=UPI001B7ECF65|nr:uncharacterized protein LOC121243373 [Juglans microcarpa x Juglans regia]
MEKSYGKGKAIIEEESLSVRGNDYVRGELETNWFLHQENPKIFNSQNQPIRVNSPYELFSSPIPPIQSDASSGSRSSRNPRNETLTFIESDRQRKADPLSASPPILSAHGSGDSVSTKPTVWMVGMNPSTIEYSKTFIEINGPPPTRKSTFNPRVNFPPPNISPSITQDSQASQSIDPQHHHMDELESKRFTLPVTEDWVSRWLKTSADLLVQTNRSDPSLANTFDSQKVQQALLVATGPEAHVKSTSTQSPSKHQSGTHSEVMIRSSIWKFGQPFNAQSPLGTKPKDLKFVPSITYLPVKLSAPQVVPYDKSAPKKSGPTTRLTVNNNTSAQDGSLDHDLSHYTLGGSITLPPPSELESPLKRSAPLTI